MLHNTNKETPAWALSGPGPLGLVKQSKFGTLKVSRK